MRGFINHGSTLVVPYVVGEGSQPWGLRFLMLLAKIGLRIELFGSSPQDLEFRVSGLGLNPQNPKP